MLISRYCVCHVLITNATISLSELVALDCTQRQEKLNCAHERGITGGGTIVGFHVSQYGMCGDGHPNDYTQGLGYAL